MWGGSICEATERNYAEGIATIIRREQAKDLREVRKSYIELLTIAECDANTEENAPAIARAQKVVNDLLGGEESENETT